jgi:hypothetical protein
VLSCSRPIPSAQGIPTRHNPRRSHSALQVVEKQRSVRLVPLVLSCCSSRLATWSASVGCSLVTTRTGDAERGRLHPPYPSGALQERYARKGGGTRWWVRGWTTTSGLHACTHAPGSAPHCCGSRCTAVGSVAATCRLLASFLSSPLPQVALVVVARVVIGGS